MGWASLKLAWKDLIVGVPYTVILHPRKAVADVQNNAFSYKCSMSVSGAEYELKLPSAALERAIRDVPPALRSSGAQVIEIVFRKESKKSMKILSMTKTSTKGSKYILKDIKVFKHGGVPLIIRKGPGVKSMTKLKMIQVTEEVHAELGKRGTMGDTFSSVIKKLLGI